AGAGLLVSAQLLGKRLGTARVPMPEFEPRRRRETTEPGRRNRPIRAEHRNGRRRSELPGLTQNQGVPLGGVRVRIPPLTLETRSGRRNRTGSVAFSSAALRCPHESK